MPHASLEPTNKRDTELQQPVGNRPGIHDVGGRDKKRHSQKQKAVKQTLNHRRARNGQVLSGHAQIDDAADENGISDRSPNSRHAEEGD